MTSFDPSSDELVSAYLDGEATEAERARVEADPALRARVETFRSVSAAVATPPPMPDAAARDAAIAAALGASNTTAKVTSLAPVQERRGRFSSAKTGILSAAAVLLVLFLGAAVVANLGGNDSQDTASGDAADSAESSDFDQSTTDDVAGATATMESMSDDDDGGTDDALSDDAASDEAFVDEPEEAMEEEAMEEEPAEEAEAPASGETGETGADSSAASDEQKFAVRTFTSLDELTTTYATEERSIERQAVELSPEVLEMADLCRTESSELDTNSLVFLEPAVLVADDGVATNVLVYRDDLVDTDRFIQVFEFGTCAPIQ